MALADYQALVPQLVRDEAGKISTTDRDLAIGMAGERYGKDRPREVAADIVVPGGALIDPPAGFIDGFSAVKSIEYPIGSTPPVFLPTETYRVYRAPLGVKLQLDLAPAAGATIRVTFTAKHQLDGAGDTVPVVDRQAVAEYAASILLEQLAALYSGDRDSTIQADSVDHASKARDYAMRAKSLRERYLAHLGVKLDGLAPAGTVVETRPKDSHGATTRLTHGPYR